MAIRFNPPGEGPRTGQPVYTTDGRLLGSIKEVTGAYIKVDAPSERDYWLKSRDVTPGIESVVLRFHDRELEDHKVAPELVDAIAMDETAVETNPVILHDDEQQRQRERMEDELAQQRADLDPSALHPRGVVPGAAPTDAPEEERVRAETLTVEELLAYREHTLLDASGEEIGPIAEICYDADTGLPEWIGVDLSGLVSRRRVVAPVFGAYILDDAISVPYSRQQVLDSGAGDVIISSDREQALYRHYGLPVSQAESATGLPQGQSRTEDTPPHMVEAVTEGVTIEEEIIGDPASSRARTADADAGVPSAIAPGLTPGDALNGQTDVAARPRPARPGASLTHDTAHRPHPSWDYDRMFGDAETAEPPGLAQRALAGAVGGLTATIPMTLAMAAMYRRLPRRERYPLPPRAITERVAEAAATAVGARHTIPGSAMNKTTLAAHGAYGAAAGAIFGLASGNDRFGSSTPVAGAVFGAAVWAVSYAGWLPATGIHRGAAREGKRRNMLMLGANMLWGAIAAIICRAMLHRDGDDDGRPYLT